MNKIEFLSTVELERLEREFQSPTTLTESIMRRGITAELRGRPGYSEPPTQREEELDEEIDRLNDQVEDLESKLADADEELRESQKEVAGLEDRVRDALVTPKPQAQAA